MSVKSFLLGNTQLEMKNTDRGQTEQLKYLHQMKLVIPSFVHSSLSLFGASQGFCGLERKGGLLSRTLKMMRTQDQASHPFFHGRRIVY